MALQLQAEQIDKINRALNADGRKEITIRVENGKLVILLVQKKKI